MTSPHRRFDVAVVGGGAIGAFCAFELARRGADVTVLERLDRWGPECSSANAGLLVPSHARPIAAPENVRAALSWMFRRGAPFGLRPARGMASWLPRYLLASRSATADAGERLQRALCEESLRRTFELQDGGLDLGVRRSGTLVVHDGADGPERAAAEVAAAPAGAARALDAAAARALEPRLRSVSAAVQYPDEGHCDPAAFVRLLGHAAEAAGAQFQAGVEVRQLRRRWGGVDLETSSGPVLARGIVIASGVGSRRLARAAGLRLPLLAGRGLALDLPLSEPMLRQPLYLHHERIVVSPMADRVRLTGGLVLDGHRKRVDRSRVEAILAVARRLGISAAPQRTWVGLRPCTPDGLPLVGRDPRAGDVVIATGHGMLGMTLAALTGEMVAELMLGGRERDDLNQLRPERFRWA